MRHPAVIRYGGLAGSAALGWVAYLAGARRTMVLHGDPKSIATGPDGILIMALWILGTAALAGAWWLGRGLVGRGILTTRWTVVTAALWSLPMLVIPPIGSRDVYAYSCQGALYAAGGNPYHQGVSSLPCPWLDSISAIWRDSPTPYGPVFFMMAGVAAKLGSLTAAIIAWRVIAVLGLVLMALCVPPICRRFGLPVERTQWLVLACPLVVLHLVGGAHNDGITIALLLAAIAVLATRYERMSGLILGGLLLGLSIAIKPMILLAVPFVALYVAGEDRTGPFGFPPIPALIRRGGTVVVSAFVALLVPTLISGLGFGWIDAIIHGGGEPTWTSPSTSVGTTLNALLKLVGVHINAIPVAHTVGLVLLPISLLLIFWRARHTDRFFAAGVALTAVTFFSPTVQPWYLVWPLVLFAITPAAVRWFAVAAILACFTALPDGIGLDSVGRLPLSIGMTVVVILGLVGGIGWLRGARPRAISDPTSGSAMPSATVTESATEQAATASATD